MNRRIASIPLLILIAVSAMAQMGTPPGPEVKKLDYFVGSWMTEGTIAQGPWGAGGKFTGSGKAEWMPGNFFVQSHSEAKMPPEIGGDTQSVMIIGYDSQQKPTRRIATAAWDNTSRQKERSVATLGHGPVRPTVAAWRSSRR